MDLKSAKLNNNKILEKSKKFQSNNNNNFDNNNNSSKLLLLNNRLNELNECKSENFQKISELLFSLNSGENESLKISSFLDDQIRQRDSINKSLQDQCENQIKFNNEIITNLQNEYIQDLIKQNLKFNEKEHELNLIKLQLKNSVNEIENFEKLKLFQYEDELNQLKLNYNENEKLNLKNLNFIKNSLDKTINSLLSQLKIEIENVKLQIKNEIENQILLNDHNNNLTKQDDLINEQNIDSAIDLTEKKRKTHSTIEMKLKQKLLQKNEKKLQAGFNFTTNEDIKLNYNLQKIIKNEINENIMKIEIEISNLLSQKNELLQFSKHKFNENVQKIKLKNEIILNENKIDNQIKLLNEKHSGLNNFNKSNEIYRININKLKNFIFFKDKENEQLIKYINNVIDSRNIIEQNLIYSINQIKSDILKRKNVQNHQNLNNVVLSEFTQSDSEFVLKLFCNRLQNNNLNLNDFDNNSSVFHSQLSSRPISSLVTTKNLKQNQASFDFDHINDKESTFITRGTEFFGTDFDYNQKINT